MGKKAEINKEFSKFLKEFGSRPISIKEDKISLREFIEKIILDGASDKVFNTGEAKKCMYCKTTTLYKKHCINKTNRILCSGCKDKFICFKCLCKWDDRRIDHKKCIDSIDCDLFQEYGKGKVYVEKKTIRILMITVSKILKKINIIIHEGVIIVKAEQEKIVNVII